MIDTSGLNVMWLNNEGKQTCIMQSLDWVESQATCGTYRSLLWMHHSPSCFTTFQRDLQSVLGATQRSWVSIAVSKFLQSYTFAYLFFSCICINHFSNSVNFSSAPALWRSCICGLLSNAAGYNKQSTRL